MNRWGRGRGLRPEGLLVGLGLALLLAWGVLRFHGWYGSGRAIRDFRETVGELPPTVLPGEESPVGELPEPDRSLWAEGRVKAWRESLSGDPGRTLGVLSIPSIGLTVPVFDGTDEVVLNRGVGRIQGTARPGGHGNVGLAGHRDGFFRGLKDVAVGDRIVLETPAGVETFVIDDLRVVSPKDVSVLAPLGSDAVTLVTCFPFYHVGRAPKRFIVRAVREPHGPE